MQDGKDKNSETKKYNDKEERGLKVESRQASADKEGLSSKADGRQKTDVAAEKSNAAGNAPTETGKKYSYSFESVSDADSADGSDARARGAAADGTKRGGKNGGAAAKAKKRSDGSVKFVAWTLVALAAIIVLIIILSNTGTSKGIIKGAKDYRYGESNSVNLNLEDYRYRKGDTVVWKMDGKEVQKKDASDKSAFVFNTASASVGSHSIKAELNGKEIAEFSMTVNKPLLKIKANDTSAVYGEETAPTYRQRSCGQHTAESLGLVGLAQTQVKTGDAAGEYEIGFREFVCQKYDVEIETGTIRVLPREVTFDATERLVKEYDGTDTVLLKDIPLNGSVNGDVLKMDATARFSDKNAGEKKSVTLENVSIKGGNAENYTLGKVALSGDIMPKTVVLKIWSLTTKCSRNDKRHLAQVGMPDGVAERTRSR
ncbi:MAG: YDG domain-containing protein [Christensenellales bacterium]